jgi:drug/metabolite transporter (DMT)-like permease
MHRTTGRWKFGLVLALITAAFWGILPIGLKLLLTGMDAFTITWYRFVVAAAVLALVLAASRRIPDVSTLSRRDWFLLGMALLGLVANYVFYLLALHHVTPTVNQTVIQLSPMLLLFGGLIVFRERFSRWQWLGFIALIVGLLLFFNRRLPELADLSHGRGLGVALLLAAAVVWAIYGLVQKQLLKRMSSQQILLVLYLGAVLLLLPLSSPGDIRYLDTLEWWMLAFCCANTLIGYGAFAEALEHWEISRVSAVLALAPLVTLSGMWAVERVFPGILEPEGLNALSVFGALLVVAGSALSALGARDGVEPGV